MRVTIKDIAERVGVSPGAVSFALRGTGRLDAQLRAEIRRVADELGYRPNLLVHGIRTGRSLSVGVLIDVRYEFAAQIFAGVHDRLLLDDYVPVVLYPAPGKTELEQLHRLVDRRVDGLLIRPSDGADWGPHMPEILRRDLPVVSVDVAIPGAQVHVVATDDRRGGVEAARHLLDLGHRLLAVITAGGPFEPLALRAAAFAETVRAAGGECQVLALAPAEHEHVYQPALAALRRDPRPTGLFLTSDGHAPEVYQAAAALGLHIPADLSVLGFADLSVASLLSPPLTTFRQDAAGIGSRAAELLLADIRGAGGPPQAVSWPAELVLRGSTGRVPLETP